MEHHAIPADADLTAHEADLEELSNAGLFDIEHGRPWKLFPTPHGRKVVQDYAVATETELLAPADLFLEAAEHLSESPNPLAWVEVRALLGGLRDHLAGRRVPR